MNGTACAPTSTPSVCAYFLRDRLAIEHIDRVVRHHLFHSKGWCQVVQFHFVLDLQLLQLCFELCFWVCYGFQLWLTVAS